MMNDYQNDVIGNLIPGYFEKQVNLHCALHSLNNLVQCKLFSFEELTSHAVRLHRTATDNLKNSNSIPRQSAATYYNENGDFSQEVIEEALIGKDPEYRQRCRYPHKANEGTATIRDAM